VILYGCETWSLTLREEHRLRVFENKVLRRRRKLHNEELRDLYFSPSVKSSQGGWGERGM
jgi:hypothetical protein